MSESKTITPEIEKVAMALCRCDEQNGGPPWEMIAAAYGRKGLTRYYEAATAAMEALMEPSKEMLEAAEIEGGMTAKADWQAMLSHALGKR